MSFFWKNSSQPENLPKGVNTQFSSFSRKKDDAKEGYNNQKINFAANIENKKTTKVTKTGRPGADWDDDDDTKQVIQPAKGSIKEALENQNNYATTNKNVNITENNFYPQQELLEFPIEYELKSVADIINPSGIRVKPTDALLREFGRACESLKTEIIGSILLNNIISDIPWNILMKSLYVIEYLIKTQMKYKTYFHINKSFFDRLIEFDDESQNNQSSLLKTNIVNILENRPTIESSKLPNDSLMKAINLQGGLSEPNKNLLDLNPESLDQPAKKTGFGFIKKSKEQEFEESNNILKSTALPINPNQTKPQAISKKFDPFSLSQKNTKKIPQVEQATKEEKSEKSSFGFLNKKKAPPTSSAPNPSLNNNMDDLLSLDINYDQIQLNGGVQLIETKKENEKIHSTIVNQNMNQNVNANILNPIISKTQNPIIQNNANLSHNLNFVHQPINLPYQQPSSFAPMNSMNYPQNFQNLQNYQNFNNLQNLSFQNMQHFQNLQNMQNMSHLQNMPQFQNLYNSYPPQINLNPQMTSFYFAQMEGPTIGGGEEIKKEVEKKKVLDESAFDFVKLS